MRRQEYATAEVVSFGDFGGQVHGKQEFDSLISEGWQIVDKDSYETEPDADGYVHDVIRYKLQR